MKAIAEIEVLSLGEGASQHEAVERACALLEGSNLTVQTHAMGTNVEGELYDVLFALKQVHEALHQDGSARVSSRLTVETRQDKAPDLQERAHAG